MNLNKQLIIILLLLPLGYTGNTMSQDKLKMEGTAIIGNKELPNVLYIVPWKSVERFNIEGPPIASIMDQKLVPLKRKAFRRRINYYQPTVSTATIQDNDEVVQRKAYAGSGR